MDNWSRAVTIGGAAMILFRILCVIFVLCIFYLTLHSSSTDMTPSWVELLDSSDAVAALQVAFRNLICLFMICDKIFLRETLMDQAQLAFLAKINSV